jgi:hypothetical protein
MERRAPASMRRAANPGEARRDLHLHLFQDELGAEFPVDLGQILAGGGVEVPAPGDLRDLAEGLLVELHPHGPASEAHDLPVPGSEAHGEDPDPPVRGQARHLDGIGAGGGLPIGEKDDGRRGMAPRFHGGEAFLGLRRRGFSDGLTPATDVPEAGSQIEVGLGEEGLE